MNKTPLGIKLIAWFLIITTLLFLSRGFLYFLAQSRNSGLEPTLIGAFLLLLSFSILAVMAGWGLLRLQKWAFVLTFVVCLVNMVLAVLNSLALIGLIFNLIFITVLFQNKKAFGYD